MSNISLDARFKKAHDKACKEALNILKREAGELSRKNKLPVVSTTGEHQFVWFVGVSNNTLGLHAFMIRYERDFGKDWKVDKTATTYTLPLPVDVVKILSNSSSTTYYEYNHLEDRWEPILLKTPWTA